MNSILLMAKHPDQHSSQDKIEFVDEVSQSQGEDYCQCFFVTLIKARARIDLLTKNLSD